MLSMKCFQVAALALAVVGFGFVPAGDAMAGSCKSDRSYDRGHHSRDYGYQSGHDRWHRSSSHRDYSRSGYDSRTRVSYRNDNVRFSVSVGSHRSYDRGYHQPTYRSSSSCSKTVVYHHPQSGYWKRVYHRPVYETRYDSCGRPYRVCVRAGYYERVWVSTSHRRY